MSIEDIVTEINNYIIDARKRDNIEAKGYLVILRKIEINTTFKAYRTCTDILWYIYNGHKYRVLSSSLTGKVSANKEDSLRNDMDLKTFRAILDWINTEYYQLLIKGIYYGSAD